MTSAMTLVPDPVLEMLAFRTLGPNSLSLIVPMMLPTARRGIPAVTNKQDSVLVREGFYGFGI